MTLATAARGLSLAAAPVFALMAVATGLHEARADAAMCGPLAMSPFGGMAVMYALMAGVHLAPWLRLASERRASSLH